VISPVWISVDSTSMARPAAETSPDRGRIYVCNLPHESRPVSVGWQFSTLMLVPEQRSSWGAILSQRRIQSQQTAVSVAMEQVEQVRPLLPGAVRILADRWYATGAFLLACQHMQVEVLLRLKRNRKLYRPAPVPLKRQRGAPRKDGPLVQGSHPETWGEPEQEWKGTDETGKPMVVQVWHRLHFRQAREVEVSIYRVLRERARGSKRDPRERGFCWMGKAPLALEEVAASYRHRFSHEHTSSLSQARSLLDQSAGAHSTAI
jgi:hypothetical protein